MAADKPNKYSWEEWSRLLSEKEAEEEAAASANQAKKLWKLTEGRDETGYEPDVDQAWQRFKARASLREEVPAASAPAPKKLPIWWAVAASVALLGLFGLWFLSLRTTEALPQQVVVATAVQQKEKIILPDGSVVWLNENSSLRYAENFSVDDRTVHLKGEAFFEVAKAEGKRFTIYAGPTVTEVIGTSFNLQAPEEGPVVVQVVTGKVAFASTLEQEAVFLTPGEQAVFKPEAAEPVKEEINDPNFRAWQSGELVFTNTSLEQLSQTLSDYFGQEVALENPDLANCRFTASFQDPSMEEVLEVLRLTGNFSLTRTAKGYQIGGSACKP